MSPRVLAAVLLALLPVIGAFGIDAVSGFYHDTLGTGVLLAVAVVALLAAVLSAPWVSPAGRLVGALGFAALWSLVGCAVIVAWWTAFAYPISDPEWGMIFLVLPMYGLPPFVGAAFGFTLRWRALGRAT